MSFKDDLLKSRGHLIIIVAIIVSLSVIIRLEKYSTKIKNGKASEDCVQNTITAPDFLALDNYKYENLTKEEEKYAKIAWKYFENNYIPETGYVNSVNQYNASTVWDTASYLMALLSAYKLELIDKNTFDKKLSKILDSLENAPLFDNKFPNKSYNTKTNKMVDYSNKDSERGIGSSSIDIGRLMVPFYTISINYPEYYNKILKIISRFNFSEMLENEKMYGFSMDGDKIKRLREGRLGYEQYAAKSLELMGFNLARAKNYETNLKMVKIGSNYIPADTRESKELGGKNYVLSEPYILDGLEHHWDNISKKFSYMVYKAQEERFKTQNILTAVSEDNIDIAPYFVYNTVYNEGKEWNCTDPDGKDANDFRTLSTKAVFGLHYLYNTDYTSTLMDKIKDNYDKDKGWYSGIYEKDGRINKSITSNTNGVILEALVFKKFGKLASVNIKRKE